MAVAAGIAGAAVVYVLYVPALQRAVSREQRLRAAERAGRTRAEAALRRGVTGSRASDPSDVHGHRGHLLTPIGRVATCFPDRRGAPRQPLLVPDGRATFTLARELPNTLLENLDEFSHCWLIFVFDSNTDLHRAAGADAAAADIHRTKIKGKVAPPQLGGRKVGVLSTRTPHRPCNIGLSAAQIHRVDVLNRRVELRGIDLIDGTNLLDIKPYLPFDAVGGGGWGTAAEGAGVRQGMRLRVPGWIDRNSEFRPRPVGFAPEAEARLRDYVDGGHSRFWGKGEADAFLETVKQALRLDIRSQHQGRGSATGEHKVFSVSLDTKALTLDFVTLENGVRITGVRVAAGQR